MDGEIRLRQWPADHHLFAAKPTSSAEGKESSVAAAARALSEENFAQGCIKSDAQPDVTMQPSAIAMDQIRRLSPTATRR